MKKKGEDVVALLISLSQNNHSFRSAGGGYYTYIKTAHLYLLMFSCAACQTKFFDQELLNGNRWHCQFSTSMVKRSKAWALWGTRLSSGRRSTALSWWSSTADSSCSVQHLTGSVETTVILTCVCSPTVLHRLMLNRSWILCVKFSEKTAGKSTKLSIS